MGEADAIVVRLMGGLGNQLFQYACGRALATQHGLPLLLDPREVIRKGAHSGLAIELFNIKAEFIDGQSKYALASWKWKVSRAIRRQISPSLGYYHEQEFGFDEDLVEHGHNNIISGFWQSYKYFDKSAVDLLRKEFTLKKPYTKDQQQIVDEMHVGNGVAVHVRRGDYLNNPKALAKHGVCSAEYYQQAVARIEALVDDPHYFVFSDDPQWVKQNINIDNAVFVSDRGYAPEVDLMLISSCQHQIIANSSFSWWGAYINANADKHVIIPDPWFDADICAKDMSPIEWIRCPK